MKRIKYFLIALLLTQVSLSQSANSFEIKETVIKNVFKRKHKRNFQNISPGLYSDSLVTCSSSCAGEFGGSIIFKKRKTGETRRISATCPIAVNRIGSTYYVTNTLAHMFGMSDVIEVDTNFNVKQLADSVGILTLTSFVYNDHLYHITAYRGKTYLTEIQKGKFETIALISNKELFAHDPEMIKTVNGHTIVFFYRYKTRGYIDIYKNKINVTRYR